MNVINREYRKGQCDYMQEFYCGKKVLVTGHTGFKGSWLCKILINLGAEVTGYALKPDNDINLFRIAKLDNHINSVFADIRDKDSLKQCIERTDPDIVIHMAAQPLVLESYRIPDYTYETNVMGTVHLLDALRNCSSVKSIVNVTTDKVYKNMERETGYVEDEMLDGFDPYSNSKSCSELVTNSYRSSFFLQKGVSVSTVRSGNVIGGGDFSDNRIIPDCFKAAIKNEKIVVRNPYSVRPYQHVIEPLMAYLLVAREQYFNPMLQGAYNVGPLENDCINTEELVKIFCSKWGNDQKCTRIETNGPHEARLLKLNCSKIHTKLGWKAFLNIEQAVGLTVEWMKSYVNGDNIDMLMDAQISNYMQLMTSSEMNYSL